VRGVRKDHDVNKGLKCWSIAFCTNRKLLFKNLLLGIDKYIPTFCAELNALLKCRYYYYFAPGTVQSNANSVSVCMPVC